MESLYGPRADPVAELMLPDHAEFTSAKAPPPDVRSVVRRSLLMPRVSAGYEERDGSIRVSEQHGAVVIECTRALGECADDMCSCNRLKRPKVRQSFRDGVVAAVTEALSSTEASAARSSSSSSGVGSGGDSGGQSASSIRKPVRYVTLGSGLLLTDFEILCGLVDQGLRIGSVVAVDTEYRALPTLIERRRRVQDDVARANALVRCLVRAVRACCELPLLAPLPEELRDLERRKAESHEAALRQLAEFFAPARVYAFPSLRAMRAACGAQPDRFGGATTVVLCDSADIQTFEGLALSRSALVEGG